MRKIKLVVTAILFVFLSATTGSGQVDVNATITADNAYGFGFGDINGMTSYFGGIRNILAGEIFNGPPVLYTNAAALAPHTNPNVGPELYNLQNVANSDYLYVVAWSDAEVTQGLIASFEVNNSGILTGNSQDWRVFATGMDRNSDIASDTLTITDLLLINSQIQLANTNNAGAGTSKGWVDENGLMPDLNPGVGRLVYGEDNVVGSTFAAVNNFVGVIQGVAPSAQWQWYNEDPASISNPFQASSGGGPDGHGEFLIFRLPISAISELELCAGDMDDFQAGDPEDVPTQRPIFRQALSFEHNNFVLHGGVPLNYDSFDSDHTFGQSFITGNVDLSQPVTLKMKLANWGSNDTIRFQLIDSQVPSMFPGQLWSPPMSTSTSIQTFVDTYGQEDVNCATVEVDLRNIIATVGPYTGQTIAQTINDLGHLDVFIQDDTAIDYMCLCYTPGEPGPPTDCGSFEVEQVLCRTEDGMLNNEFTVTGFLQNLTGQDVNVVSISPTATNDPNVSLCFGSGSTTDVPAMPIAPGDQVYCGATEDNEIVIKAAMPGDEVCFELTLGDGSEACSFEVCVKIPDCDCVQIDARSEQITNSFGVFGPGFDCKVGFQYTFDITNLLGPFVFQVDLIPTGNENFTPSSFPLPFIDIGQTETISTFVTCASPNQDVEFTLVVYSENGKACEVQRTIRAPNCLIPDRLGDVNLDGAVDLLDVDPFIGVISNPGTYVPSADTNFDGAINLLDVGPFVDLLLGG